MKKYFLLVVIFICFKSSFAQLYISTGSQFVLSGNSILSLENTSLTINGSFNSGNSTIRLSGVSDNNIGGNTNIEVYHLEMAKTGQAKIILQKDISVKNGISFSTGLLELNQHSITLDPLAALNNENENSFITGVTGGEVIISTTMNAPLNTNAGNLGAVISSNANLGQVTIRRGHKTQAGTGLNNSIYRYYSIQPANNNNLNATCRFNYLSSELNGQNEAALEMYNSINNGLNWTNQNFTTRNTVLNFVEKTGMNSFALHTLSASGSVVPVTGLDFQVSRISKTAVQLNWKTIQEINNKGFHIERKKENENNFTDIAFVNSKALNGNSTFNLDYQHQDNNSFSGTTYYRLKQEDFDGRNTYSILRIVKGDVNKQLSMQVWPIPATGPVNIMVNGLMKTDILMLFDMNGKLVKQQTVQNNTPVQMNNLVAGTYIVRLAEHKDLVQKIIVQ